jgi:hypothetical protein
MQVRDVCTYSIVFRSVTKGPAVKNDEDSAVAKVGDSTPSSREVV